MIAVAWGKPTTPTVRPKEFVTAMERIMHEVALKHRVTINELKSERRSRYIAWPRQEIMWRASRETRLSLPAIGYQLGGRDHTTVMHGIKQHEKRLREANGAA